MRRLIAEDSATRALDYVSKWPRWSFDTESTGLRPEHGDRMIGCSIEPYDKDGKFGDALYLPFRHRTGGNVPIDYLPRLLRVLESRDEVRVWNLSHDLRICWKEGMAVDINGRDCMLDNHLIDENAKPFALKTVASQLFGQEAVKAQATLDYDLAGVLGDHGDMDRLPPSKVAAYACDDVSLLRRIAERQEVELERQDLLDVSAGVSKYARVVARMMWVGIQTDRDRIDEAILDAKRRGRDATVDAYNLAGRAVKLNNNEAVAKWLGIASTADKYLEMLAERPEYAEKVDCVRRYRAAVKAHGSYYRKFRDMATDDGVIHASMLLHGTISGRLSVIDPPLQSLPRDTETYLVKWLIVARPGYVLVSADYRQAEMCLAAHYGNDHAMLAILGSGENVHTMVAKELGIPKDRAKRLNFSCIYGIGAEALADRMNISMQAAEQYLRKYHGRYRGFRRLYSAAQTFADTNGYIPMWTKRRRHYTRGDATPTHKASSNLIQGGVNELMRRAQTDLYFGLRDQGIRQILQVHDNAVMEVPEDIVESTIPQIREIMEDHKTFRTPMRVDIEVGQDLANMRRVA